jgi:hypothetical protein
MDVELPRAHAAQELASYITEFIVLLIEADGIEEHHLREAIGQIGLFARCAARLPILASACADPLEEAVLALVVARLRMRLSVKVLRKSTRLSM